MVQKAVQPSPHAWETHMNCLVDLTKDPYRFAFVYYVVLVISEELKGYFCEEAGKPEYRLKYLGMYESLQTPKLPDHAMPPKPAPPGTSYLEA
jgi:hypothetical protein